jgi:translation initiation factor IF-3
LIGHEGEQLGVMPPEEAIALAREVGLDLVEVAPGASPPVCRIMDYGRYKYEQKKKAGKSKGHSASLKEIKMRPRTDQHDLEFKLKNARKFLMDGDKVKITVMFRGREIVHRDLGHQQLRVVQKLLGNLAAVENPPRMEGRFLSMIMVPNREGVAEARKAQEAEAAQETEATPETEEAQDAEATPEAEAAQETEATPETEEAQEAKVIPEAEAAPGTDEAAAEKEAEAAS